MYTKMMYTNVVPSGGFKHGKLCKYFYNIKSTFLLVLGSILGLSSYKFSHSQITSPAEYFSLFGSMRHSKVQWLTVIEKAK